MGDFPLQVLMLVPIFQLEHTFQRRQQEEQPSSNISKRNRIV